jgi:hypothetical protein
MGTTKAGTLDVAAIEERPWLRVLVRNVPAKLLALTDEVIE